MSSASQAEVSEIDASARWPLVLLLASALLWLLVSGALALVNYVQTFSPAFLAGCPAFSYGRTHAMQETAFIYGWVADAGFALALWLLGRLGGFRLRSLNWVVVGTVFWNLGVSGSLIGILVGEGTAQPYLHMPRVLLPFMLVAFAAIVTPAILALFGRSRPSAFIGQWYAAAALFLFPWLLSAALITLGWAEPRGVVQAVADNWFVQGTWSYWIAPLALAAAYYLVPKITGRVIPHYDFTTLGFWVLIVLGGWSGARHLAGGPVPAWIASLAIVATVVMLFHYLVVALNLSGAFGKGSTVLKFVAAGVACYLLVGVADAVTSLRDVAVFTQFTWIDQAVNQLALTGAFSLIAFGAIYFLVPRILNRAWPSTPLIRAHFAAALLGTLGLVLGLASAGYVQGHDLANPATSFADIATHTHVWLEIAAASQVLLLVGNALLAFHFLRALLAKPAKAEDGLFRAAPTMEASVS